MRGLAIDPGTTFGWCVFDDRILTSGSVRLRGDDTENSEGWRFIRFQWNLHNLLKNFECEAIVYESLPFMQLSQAASSLRWGWVAVMKMVACSGGVPASEVDCRMVKRAAGCHGKSDKLAMLRAARLAWPDWKGKDHNECDARWIACAAIHMGVTR